MKSLFCVNTVFFNLYELPSIMLLFVLYNDIDDGQQSLI